MVWMEDTGGRVRLVSISVKYADLSEDLKADHMFLSGASGLQTMIIRKNTTET